MITTEIVHITYQQGGIPGPYLSMSDVEIGYSFDAAIDFIDGHWTACTTNEDDQPNWTATGATRQEAIIRLLAARCGVELAGI